MACSIEHGVQIEHVHLMTDRDVVAPGHSHVLAARALRARRNEGAA